METRPEANSGPPLGPGDTIGDCYVLKEQIGVGGMGAVFLGIDQRLNRQVAVKVMKRGLDTQMLLREARIMAAFDHAGFPTVYALGEHEGIAYLVMEYLRGRTLRSHLEHVQPILSLEETRRVMVEISDSLQLLHGAHLAHRDLKPANIMLVPPGRVVLMDFGISDVERFASDSIAGSPHYMAPEVARGKLKSGSAHLTDVYALGVIGYQLLTGRTPFYADSILSLLDVVTREEAPPIRSVRQDIPLELAELITEMLSQEPAGRPQSIELVAARLRAIDLNATVPQQTPKPAESAVRILAADDEPRIWELMSYVFEDKGYDITFAANGEEALSEFSRAHFDIVIADKNMPKLDGLQLLIEVKKRRPATDVVLITGYPSLDAAVRALNYGAVRFVLKPFDIDELASVIDTLAGKHVALRETQPLRQFLR